MPEYEKNIEKQDDGTYKITNTHTPEKVTASVKKEWNDAQDQLKWRPDTLTVELKADGQSLSPEKTVTLTKEDRWAEKTISDLPKYKFTISEANGVRTVTKTPIVYSWVERDLPDTYKLTESKTEDVTGTATTGTLTTITNTLKTGNLTITKQITDESLTNAVKAGYAESSFTVLITLAKGEETISGTFPATGSKSSVTFTEGIATITIKNGETVTIEKLPENAEYTVTEIGLEDCWRLVDIQNPKGKIADGTTIAVTVKNEFLVGKLLIKKTVTGNRGMKTLAFPFKVEFLDKQGNEIAGSFKYTGSKSGFVKSGETIRIKHGEYIIIEQLPVGITYQVTETNSYNHHVTSTGEVGKIVENTTVTASFVNHRSNVPKTGETNLLPVTVPMMGASGLGMILTALFGKKRKSRKSK